MKKVKTAIVPSAPLTYICLQVSVAVGCAVRDRNVVFASTFAAFFTRAYDQLRMAAISESNINLCGSHCGVSIGQYSSRRLQDVSYDPLTLTLTLASVSFCGVKPSPGWI